MQNIISFKFWIWKTNSLLTLINQQPDIDQIYLINIKKKYQLLFNKRENAGLKDSNGFMKPLLNTPMILMIFAKMLKDAIQTKNKILIVFHHMIADMLSNKKLNPMVTKSFIRGRKLNISLVFITQSYYSIPKNIRLHSTH